MKKLLASITLLVVTICMWAIPAKPVVFTHTQTDGTVIEYRLRGDEFHKYKTTTDNYLIKLNAHGDYEYAQLKGGKIISTGVKANNLAVRSAQEIAMLSSIETAQDKASQLASIREHKASSRSVSPRSAYAAPRGIVILVNFSDVSFLSSTANADFDNLLNQTGYSAHGATGSANDYFKSVSMGAYDPEFDVYGPYTLDHSMEYYGANDYDEDDVRPAQMVLDAMVKLMADNTVSVNLNDFDSDNDGVLNNIFVFYAGHNEAEGASANTIWPHAWEVNAYNSTGSRVFGGKTLSGYACTSELRAERGSTMSGIGTFSHEFTHVLGLPDIYATDYSDHKTSGDWDIMDAGAYLNDGNTPPSYSAYERFFMGWLTPEILNRAGQFDLPNIIASNDAYLISSDGTHNLDGDNPLSKNFYLLENRVKEGWDAYLPGEGMIVTAIRYDAGRWASNEVNNTEWYMGVDIIEADGDAPDYDPYDYTYAYYGKPGDAFPGSDNVRSFTPYTRYPLTNIQFVNDTISFDFMGGVPLYTVKFSTNTYGSCAVSSLKETSEGSGVVLPAVAVAADSITFEGWATTRSATVADAGDAGDTYLPQSDITLYALFSVNGNIVDDVLPEGDCIVETFDRLTGMESSVDISSSIGSLADNAGWSGEKLFPYNGAVKIGSNSKKGHLRTPSLGHNGDISITIRTKGKEATTLYVYVDDQTTSAAEVSISDTYGERNFTVSGVSALSTLKFTSGVNVFYIDNIEICADGGTTTGGDNLQIDVVPMLLNGNTLVGLEAGDIIRCYDAQGRIFYTANATASTMDIAAPQGLFIVQIERSSDVIVIKGLN